MSTKAEMNKLLSDEKVKSLFDDFLKFTKDEGIKTIFDNYIKETRKTDTEILAFRQSSTDPSMQDTVAFGTLAVLNEGGAYDYANTAGNLLTASLESLVTSPFWQIYSVRKKEGRVIELDDLVRLEGYGSIYSIGGFAYALGDADVAIIVESSTMPHDTIIKPLRVPIVTADNVELRKASDQVYTISINGAVNGTTLKRFLQTVSSTGETNWQVKLEKALKEKIYSNIDNANTEAVLRKRILSLNDILNVPEGEDFEEYLTRLVNSRI